MKTSNKTKTGFIGIAFLAMVLSLVNINMSAQEMYYNNSLTEFSKKLIIYTPKDIFRTLHTIRPVFNLSEPETLEDWMMNPLDWKNNSTTNFEERDFEEDELILEEWMMQPNWEDNSRGDEELVMEDWMMDPKSW